ncbi:hypothetical protein CLIM01_04935 [Colletotrichum limetticola]|uniref:Uncharacterized protein n=1 Tax=Colletotrichum limetticola TaxID=1209924 RepID=A0ABQ9Q1S0_9PEZI|nr:hypothetical protein CLIM01_04935 [Colletotrichum limetticola]
MLGSKLTHCVANRTDSHGRDHASLSFGIHPEGTTHRRSVRCPSPSFAISPCVKRPDFTHATRPSGTRALPFPVSSWTPARRLGVGGGREGYLAASVQRLAPPPRHSKDGPEPRANRWPQTRPITMAVCVGRRGSGKVMPASSMQLICLLFNIRARPPRITANWEN